MKLSSLRSIGEKREKEFNKLGIFEVEDLVRYYPRAYLDLTERRLYRADGGYTDVSADIAAECDVFSLLPGVIMRFHGFDGEAVEADYSFSYKNRIGG